MIRHEGDKWQVLSEDGSKHLGTYGSKAEAVKRLRQVEYFKDKNAKSKKQKKERYSLQCTLPDLDNGNYHVERDVPVFHDGGEGHYSEQDLHEIAENTNARQQTCDLPAIVIGHIREELPEHLQPPVVGFARNFRVVNFANRPTIIADLAIHKDHIAEAKKFPRRSAEIWTDGKYIDPIALLGASTPARDLTLMFSKSGKKVYCKECENNPAGLNSSMPDQALVSELLQALESSDVFAWVKAQMDKEQAAAKQAEQQAAMMPQSPMMDATQPPEDFAKARNGMTPQERGSIRHQPITSPNFDEEAIIERHPEYDHNLGFVPGRTPTGEGQENISTKSAYAENRKPRMPISRKALNDPYETNLAGEFVGDRDIDDEAYIHTPPPGSGHGGKDMPGVGLKNSIRPENNQSLMSDYYGPSKNAKADPDEWRWEEVFAPAPRPKPKPVDVDDYKKAVLPEDEESQLEEIPPLRDSGIFKSGPRLPAPKMERLAPPKNTGAFKPASKPIIDRKAPVIDPGAYERAGISRNAKEDYREIMDEELNRLRRGDRKPVRKMDKSDQEAPKPSAPAQNPDLSDYDRKLEQIRHESRSNPGSNSVFDPVSGRKYRFSEEEAMQAEGEQGPLTEEELALLLAQIEEATGGLEGELPEDEANLEAIGDEEEAIDSQEEAIDSEEEALADEEEALSDEEEALAEDEDEEEDLTEEESDMDNREAFAANKRKLVKYQKALHGLKEQYSKRLADLERTARVAERKNELLQLEAEGYEFNFVEELNDVTDMPREQYSKHLQRIRKCYRKAPIGPSNIQPAYNPPAVKDSWSYADARKAAEMVRSGNAANVTEAFNKMRGN